MPAFLQKMMQANPNQICTAKGADVKTISVRELLSQRLRIPVFQRRYTWGREQWAMLLADARLVASGSKSSHALGRITTVKRGDDDRMAVIDGQQRNTTCSLLLAAIRDTLMNIGEPCSDLVASIDAALLPDRDGLEKWLAARQGKAVVIHEGEELPFAALVPTYCDRAAFFAALLPSSANAIAEAEWQRPMEAKRFFLEQLLPLNVGCLRQLAEAVLEKLKFLHFPITVDTDHADGTEDLHVIYERLAQRDATFCKPQRDGEGASMGAADFVRNLLLGSFQREETAVDLYKRHWLPIEQAAAEAAKQSRFSGVARFLEEMLEAFLAVQPERHDRGLALPTTVGGNLYARFRRWLGAAISSASISAEATGVNESERQTMEILKRLKDFAVPHLAASAQRQSKSTAVCAKVAARPKPQVGARWRCDRCMFLNGADSVCCTACLQRRPDA
jgi:hypothetical protein